MSHWKDNLIVNEELHKELHALESAVSAAGEQVLGCLKKGNKILACGNGGSASQASHFVTELVGRFKKDRKPLNAICLNSDGAALTCVLNDYGPNDVFRRQVEVFGEEGDILIVLTTSGNSKNVILAVEEAKKQGVTTVGIIGKDGGELKGKTDYEILVPHGSTDRIQEVHLLVIHTLCDMIDEHFALW